MVFLFLLYIYGMTVIDSPNCACGFMSVERVYALLDITAARRYKGQRFGGQQLMIFPNATFKCSGEVAKWIIGGSWNGFGNEFPELQIWRSSGESVYQKVNGTHLYVLNDESDDVHEYTLDPPLPFQPGDILGLFQPNLGESILRLEYDGYGGSLYYTQYLFELENILFNISDKNVSSRIGVPLVSASIGKIYYINLNNSCTACIPAGIFNYVRDFKHIVFTIQ